MKKQETIDLYEKACNEVAEKFNNLYFGGEADTDTWVGDIPGSVLMLSDYFFDFDFMITALRYDATEKQVFDYYDLQMETEGLIVVNFKNYIKYYKGLKL